MEENTGLLSSRSIEIKLEEQSIQSSSADWCLEVTGAIYTDIDHIKTRKLNHRDALTLFLSVLDWDKSFEMSSCGNWWSSTEIKLDGHTQRQTFWGSAFGGRLRMQEKF